MNVEDCYLNYFTFSVPFSAKWLNCQMDSAKKLVSLAQDRNMNVNGREFCSFLDEIDILREFRDSFLIPQPPEKSIRNCSIYFCGN